MLASYVWTGRTIEYHRAQIRGALGFREATIQDEESLARWLAEEVCLNELGEERQREALLARCRVERLEPPGPSQVDRVLAAGRADAEQRFCAQTVERLSAEAIERLEELAGAGREDGAGGRGLLAELKADPGPLGLETLLTEIAKLGRVRAMGLPPDLFASASEKLVAAWRVRAATQYPSHFQAMAQPVRLTLLAALYWQRAAEITDGLVDLLILLVHRINARAESRVEGEMVTDLRPVAGKQGILFRLAGAALEQPDETVRRAIYPVVGERTLRDLVREAMANEAAMKRRIRPRALYGRLGTGRSRSRPPRRAPNSRGAGPEDLESLYGCCYTQGSVGGRAPVHRAGFVRNGPIPRTAAGRPWPRSSPSLRPCFRLHARGRDVVRARG